MEKIRLRISEQVQPLNDVFNSYTPPAGSQVEVLEFIAEVTYVTGNEALLVWDFGGDEEILWSIKSSGRFDRGITIDSDQTDGTKQLAVIVRNGSEEPAIISAYVELGVVINV